MAEDELQDEHRERLIARLNSILSVSGHDFELPPGNWAALWLSDITKLADLVDAAEARPFIYQFFLSKDLAIMENILKPWNQRIRTPRVRSGTTTPTRDTVPSLPPTLQRVATLRDQSDQDERTIESLPRISSSGSTESNSSVKRSEAAKKSCLTRDNKECILTHAGEPVEVAHIYPYSMSSVPQDGQFWRSLQTFWTTEQISRWKSVIFSDQSTEVVPNLISLSPSAHAYWGKALFALKPQNESQDGTHMDVQFFWLRPYKRMPSIPLTTTPSLPSGIMSSVNNVKLYNHLADTPIRSGDIITLRTDNPQLRPLPSRDLLEMQWILHRLTALSGGAEALFYCYGPDNDDTQLYEASSLCDEDTINMDDYWSDPQVIFSRGGVQTVY
ncbi:hypothetical protein DTO217A2_9015 [Paecilomyces variotii]|nr:hypothetical protein DTO217A2_9015 [Paecilomyces variotii]